jgi:hypothetical protein
LPDPVIAIGIDGAVKFCSIQVARVLKRTLEDLEEANIMDIVVPESRGAIRRLIQDLVAAEEVAALVYSYGNDSWSEESNGGDLSGDSSANENAVADGGGRVNVTDSLVDPSNEKNDTKGSKHETSSNDEPPAKKSKSTSSEDRSGDVVGMNIDDVMGASVTANNAGAKLSSLMHCPNNKEGNGDEKPSAMEMQKGQEPHIHRKHILAPRNAAAQKQGSQSTSSTESNAGRKNGLDLSEDSGYMNMEDSNSNFSSNYSEEESSSLSGNDYSTRGLCLIQ